MPSTAIWVDMTSSSPAAGRDLTAAARARGVGVLDAPVGGGVPAARARKAGRRKARLLTLACSGLIATAPSHQGLEQHDQATPRDYGRKREPH